SNSLIVDHVSIAGFKAWVEREDDGSLNLQDLLSGGATDTLSLAAAGVVAAVGPASDERTGAKPESPLGIQAGKVNDMHVDIAGLDLRDGAIHVYNKKSALAFTLRDLSVKTGRITSDQAFDAVLKGRIIGTDPMADASIDAQA